MGAIPCGCNSTYTPPTLSNYTNKWGIGGRVLLYNTYDSMYSNKPSPRTLHLKEIVDKIVHDPVTKQCTRSVRKFTQNSAQNNVHISVQTSIQICNR